MKRILTLLLIGITSLTPVFATSTLDQQSQTTAPAGDTNDGAGPRQSPAEKYKIGHSRHGDAYNSGPREKPWVMEGIGKVHFPITTSNPEVQMWFDQGMALLHSFWYYEAERAFRWAIK